MSGFDPDRHSLSKAIRFIGADLETEYDRVAKTLEEEFGFSRVSLLHLDELRELIDMDRSGRLETWSSWKNHDLGIEDEAEAHQEEELLAATAGEKGPPYRVIYADPGWMYRSKKAGGSMKSGAAQHYTVTTVGEISALPIRTLRHPEGSALFLWGTVPMLPECWSVFQSWGFDYKTMIFWVKDGLEESSGEINNGRLGMGSWFRGQVEYCLVGVKGDVKAFRCQRKNYVFEKSSQHSKKPEKVRRLILEATAALGGPRVELFSRDLTRGWDHWGDEVYTNLEIIDGAFRRRRGSPMREVEGASK